MKQFTKLSLASLALTVATAGAAMAQDSSTAGSLSCDVSSGVGLILVQKQQLNCVFSPSGGGPRQRYVGSIASYGIALGGVQQGHLIWGVLSVGPVGPGAIQGTYSGVGAQATVGVGLGANLLVGGDGRSISLQPLSLEGQTGINIAGGITSITLQYVP
jgi:hypothetical protein